MFFIPCAETKAVEPPSEPILRIENGMHTAAIRRIGIDAENRYLVAGSDDKTVRVWDLSTGRLIKILRIPVGDGHEGTVFAVAMSPDGRTIACAEWTGWQWDNMYSVYLFNRESGRLIKRISGLNATISNLVIQKTGMRQLNGVYIQLFNKWYGRTGHLFQGRYKAIVIHKDSHLLEVCRYVFLNPVRAEMVEKPEDYTWSSYLAAAGKGKPHPPA